MNTINEGSVHYFTTNSTDDEIALRAPNNETLKFYGSPTFPISNEATFQDYVIGSSQKIQYNPVGLTFTGLTQGYRQGNFVTLNKYQINGTDPLLVVATDCENNDINTGIQPNEFMVWNYDLSTVSVLDTSVIDTADGSVPELILTASMYSSTSCLSFLEEYTSDLPTLAKRLFIYQNLSLNITTNTIRFNGSAVFKNYLVGFGASGSSAGILRTRDTVPGAYTTRVTLDTYIYSAMMAELASDPAKTICAITYGALGASGLKVYRFEGAGASVTSTLLYTLSTYNYKRVVISSDCLVVSSRTSSTVLYVYNASAGTYLYTITNSAAIIDFDIYQDRLVIMTSTLFELRVLTTGTYDLKDSKLVSSFSTASAHKSISINSNKIAIGVPTEISGGTQFGATYVFDYALQDFQITNTWDSNSHGFMFDRPIISGHSETFTEPTSAGFQLAGGLSGNNLFVNGGVEIGGILTLNYPIKTAPTYLKLSGRVSQSIPQNVQTNLSTVYDTVESNGSISQSSGVITVGVAGLYFVFGSYYIFTNSTEITYSVAKNNGSASNTGTLFYNRSTRNSINGSCVVYLDVGWIISSRLLCNGTGPNTTGTFNSYLGVYKLT